MSILIVDDSIQIHNQLGFYLKSNGYQDLLFAGSAHEAYKHLGLDAPSVPPGTIDLILMDIRMPDIDGIEACRRIKAEECLQDIPVIMVTAENTPEGLQSAFDAGAVDYITKPLNKVELLVRISSVLKLKHESDRRITRENELLELTKLLEETNEKLQQANDMLQHLSSTDGLTDIANRRRFEEFFINEWKRVTRLSKPISIIILDVDFFKKYNDTYGHQKGDECLRKIAKALHSSLKRPCDLVARYGGEEFVALLSDTDSNGAKKVAELMQKNIAALKIEYENPEVHDTVTVSLGISTIVPKTNSIPEKLINAADKALYLAKDNGRNQIIISNESLE